MIQCPRCGDLVDELVALPVEAAPTAEAGTGDERGKPRACRWCRHELLEG